MKDFVPQGANSFFFGVITNAQVISLAALFKERV